MRGSQASHVPLATAKDALENKTTSSDTPFAQSEERRPAMCREGHTQGRAGPEVAGPPGRLQPDPEAWLSSSRVARATELAAVGRPK